MLSRGARLRQDRYVVAVVIITGDIRYHCYYYDDEEIHAAGGEHMRYAMKMMMVRDMTLLRLQEMLRYRDITYHRLSFVSHATIIIYHNTSTHRHYH